MTARREPPQARGVTWPTGQLSTRAAVLNLMATLSIQTSWAEGGDAYVVNGVLVIGTSGRVPVLPYNVALRIGDVDAKTATLTAIRQFSKRASGFSMVLRDGEDDDVREECHRLGFIACGTLPMMTLDATIWIPAMGSDIEFRWVQSSEDLEGFVTIASQAYGSHGVAPEAVRAAFHHRDQVLKGPSKLCLALVADQPVACGLLTMQLGIAGIYWIATPPQLRGKGYATRMTEHLVSAARSTGLRRITLQASSTAVGMYRRLGFREHGSLHCYCFPRARPLIASASASCSHVNTKNVRCGANVAA